MQMPGNMHRAVVQCVAHRLEVKGEDDSFRTPSTVRSTDDNWMEILLIFAVHVEGLECLIS